MAGEVAHRGGGQAVAVAQPLQAMTAQDGVDRGGRVPGQLRQARGPVAAAGAGAQDGGHRLVREAPWGTVRAAAAIEQAGLALCPIAAQPLVGGGAADPELPGRLGWAPALDDDPAHQQLAAEDRKARVRMSHESLLPIWVLNTSHRARRLSTVNNVFGDYN